MYYNLGKGINKDDSTIIQEEISNEAKILNAQKSFVILMNKYCSIHISDKTDWIAKSLKISSERAILKVLEYTKEYSFIWSFSQVTHFRIEFLLRTDSTLQKNYGNLLKPLEKHITSEYLICTQRSTYY